MNLPQYGHRTATQVRRCRDIAKGLGCIFPVKLGRYLFASLSGKRNGAKGLGYRKGSVKVSARQLKSRQSQIHFINFQTIPVPCHHYCFYVFFCIFGEAQMASHEAKVLVKCQDPKDPILEHPKR